MNPCFSMNQYKPYLEYKSSCVEWLGEIPSHWGVKKLKQASKKSALYGANEPSDSYSLDGIRFLRTTDIDDSGKLNHTSSVYLDQELVKEYLLADGDILFSRSGTLGRTYVHNAKLYGSCAYAGYLVRFVLKNYLLPKYVFYYSKTNQYYDWLNLSIIQSTIGNVNGQKYANMPIIIPPLPEQRGIAAFLDRQTAKIDALIEKYQRLIQLLQEKRAALITHAVTHGLATNVPLKDSGVEWLGKIPDHWKIKKQKYLARFNYGDSLSDVNRELGDISVYGSNGVVGEHSKPNTKSPCIIIGRKGSFGKVNYSEKSCFAIDTTFFIDSRFCKVDIRWLFYVLKNLKLDEISRDSAVPGLDREIAHNYLLPLPANDEQQAIADFLDRETAKIDDMVSKVESLIVKLQEYRSSLITAVVIGKIDIRDLIESG